MGATLARIAPGLCEIVLPVSPHVTQQHGFVHGGAVGAILDSAGGYAGFTLMDADSSVMTVEFKVNFLAPADGERILARGEVIRAGRTLTVTKGEVFALKGGRETLCATMQQTLIQLAARADRPSG